MDILDILIGWTLMLDNYMDAYEAAKALKVHPETVRRLIREKKLPATKFGNKWLIDRDRLSIFAAAYTGKPGKVSRLL